MNNPEVNHPNYQILTGFSCDGEEVSDEQLRREYLRRTERLIEDIVSKAPDYVIYLDKSARPVAWLADEMWDEVAPDEHKPQFKFINIDREQWRDQIGSNASYIDASRIDQNRINELHALFAVKPIKDNGEGEVKPSVINEPTIFDGKKVMIVDEVRATGDTLDIAKAILRRAFPKTEFSGRHWMIPRSVSQPGGYMATAEVPVWYNSKSVVGRGVDNRDSINSARSENRVQRIGRWFLSTRFNEPDSRSDQLRKEMRWLAQDYKKAT